MVIENFTPLLSSMIYLALKFKFNAMSISERNLNFNSDIFSQTFYSPYQIFRYGECKGKFTVVVRKVFYCMLPLKEENWVDVEFTDIRCSSKKAKTDQFKGSNMPLGQ